MRLVELLNSEDVNLRVSIVQRLTLANVGLVHNVVIEFMKHNQNIPYDDLMSLGILEIIKKIEKYDSSKGIMLSTFIYSCVKRCLKEFDKGNKPVCIEKHFYSKISSYNKCVNKYFNQNGNNPSIEYIKGHTDLSEGDILLIQCLSYSTISLYESKNDDISLIDSIPSYDSSVQDIIELNELIEKTNCILKNQLTYNEYFVLMYRYGLNGAKVKTQKQIAKTLGCTHQNVSRIEGSAIKKLKKSKELFGYYYDK